VGWRCVAFPALLPHGSHWEGPVNELRQGAYVLVRGRDCGRGCKLGVELLHEAGQAGMNGSTIIAFLLGMAAMWALGKFGMFGGG
jgi:hypothetical protein